MLGVSLPTFVIGILFIYLFAVILGILPSFGRGEVVDLGFWTTGFLTVSGLESNYTSFSNIKPFPNDLYHQTCASRDDGNTTNRLY